MKYHNIVFMNDYDDEYVDEFVNGDDFSDITIKGIIEYLSDWDLGVESEHSPQDEPSLDTSDCEWVEGDYVLFWNTNLGYVGLDRITKS